MTKFCFTGNPFVDAGVAGMCAAATVDTLADLDKAAVSRAVETLRFDIASDAAFKKRKIGTKESMFATSEMSVIFPNGPLTQSSAPTEVKGDEVKLRAHKKKQYEKRLLDKQTVFMEDVAGQHTAMGHVSCFVDGSMAVMQVGNDEFPLVDSKSKRNFHPGLQGGHAIGAVTALALEFFPLSVLRTGMNAGLFWFVHTANEKIAIACARLTLTAMNEAIARSEGLGFFGKWDIPNPNADAALVALIRDLMTGSGQPGKAAISSAEFEKSRYPVTAYVFSNDNRGPTIEGHDLPHQLFRFFSQLHARQTTFQRFNHEILQREFISRRAAKNMMECKPIIRICTVHTQSEQLGRLLGGWQAQTYYATEVLNMSSTFIRDVETVAERVVHDENAKDHILSLRTLRPRDALMRLSRRHLITFSEFSDLVPPDEPSFAYTARDYLLAAVYEYQSTEDQGRAFVPWDGDAVGPAHKHSLIQLVEDVGKRLSADADASKIATNLAIARSIADLRHAFLRRRGVFQRNVLSWSEFVAAFPPPPDEQQVSRWFCDALLAYLYSTLHDQDLPDAEALATDVTDEHSDDHSKEIT